MLADYLEAVEAAGDRIRRCDDELASLVPKWKLCQLVTALKALGGVSLVAATIIIAELGDEHVRTGKPIVYTSADSVFQIACHEDAALR